MPTNRPEKPFFDDIMDAERRKAEIVAEIKDAYASAKEHEEIGASGVKRLRAAVKRALKTPAQRRADDDLASEADQLAHQLGAYISTPLGEAALERARG